jgi:hypothetical protein
VPERAFTDSELEAAVESMTGPGRLADAQALVERAAPQLQRMLGLALKEGGWFDEVHEHAVRLAATTDGEEERVAAVRTLMAEEARVGMMVGVAVGYQLARDLILKQDEGGT